MEYFFNAVAEAKEMTEERIVQTMASTKPCKPTNKTTNDSIFVAPRVLDKFWINSVFQKHKINELIKSRVFINEATKEEIKKAGLKDFFLVISLNDKPLKYPANILDKTQTTNV